MSVRSEKTPAAPVNLTNQMQSEIAAAQPSDAHLAEGANYTTANSENPLHRTVVVSVRSSLNELCLQRTKGTWAPSSEALKSICTPQIFTYRPHTKSVPPSHHTPTLSLHGSPAEEVHGS